MIGAGVHALAPLGSTGCLPYLDDAEREAVVETVVGAAAGRLPVLAGVSSLGTASTVRHARHAERAGAAAVQVLPSTYWKLTEAEIHDYYRGLRRDLAPGDGLQQPVHHRHGPARAVPGEAGRAAQRHHDQESSPDEGKIARLRQACPDKTAVYIGLNRMARGGFAAGAAGWCTASANVAAAHAVNLYRCAMAGDRPGWTTGSRASPAS